MKSCRMQWLFLFLMKSILFLKNVSYFSFKEIKSKINTRKDIDERIYTVNIRIY